MIINCPSCEKNFEVDENLIPNKGRLLQCGFCNKEWYFKKRNEKKIKPTMISEISINNEDEILINNEDEILINDQSKGSKNSKINTNKAKKNNMNFGNFIFNIFSYTIVLIITAVAFIIILDTFKNDLFLIFPNLELVLYNLYESIKDINLFIHDLIK